VFIALVGVVLHASVTAATIDRQKAKPDADGKTLWYDCQDIGVRGKGWVETNTPYSRLPAKAQDLVSQPDWDLSHLSAGLQVRFSTASNVIHVRWGLIHRDLGMPHMPPTGVSGIDLYAKDKAGRWQFVANGRPTGVTNSVVLPGSPSHEFLLYLPLYNGVSSIEIGIPSDQKISVPDRPDTRGKPIVWYGHSITQGACASRPGMACTNMLGRRLNREIVNLGFSGSGVMDAQISTVIAELDASVFVLDCLANMRAEDVPVRVKPFIKTLRAAHPQTPILIVEEYQFANLQTHKGDLLRKEFDEIRAAGDPNLYWLDGHGVLGDDGDGTVDGVHPNDLGMARQADAFGRALLEILKID